MALTLPLAAAAGLTALGTGLNLFGSSKAAWKCQKCGSCCRFFKCPILTKDNLCPIYENRPKMCISNSNDDDEKKIEMCNKFRDFFKKIDEVLNNAND